MRSRTNGKVNKVRNWWALLFSQKLAYGQTLAISANLWIIVSNVAVVEVGSDIRIKFGDSRSNGSRYIRNIRGADCVCSHSKHVCV